jgi:hypothetical protein
MRGVAKSSLTSDRQQLGVLALVALLGIACGALLFMPAVPQKLAYHTFHDGRSWLAIPNALNVLSNLPFVMIGGLGLTHAWRAADTTITEALRPCYSVLFLGIFLTGFGSALYHWAPDNHTLVWDRLPMTLAFMGLFSTVVAERFDETLGRKLLMPLVLLGIGSVLYWARFDDLRFYGIVQYYPVLAIPVLIWAFPARNSHGHFILLAIGCYVVAKILEDADGHIYAIGHVLSGHTLKHLAAATGAWCIYWMVLKRKALARM